MCRARATALAIAFAALSGTPPLTPPAAAQEAVVLSTGASRGFAHAGALVGLAALGHDPDLVVGTSMGAVLGALYAAGYEPVDIWRMVVRTDWGDLFKPMPRLAGPGHDLRPSTLQVGIDLGTLEVDRGFVADWGVNRLLVHLLFEAGSAARGDFDRLARRFRAVGADVATGEEVVMAGGDLARVARISMGVPGFFAPMEWNGRLLIDGGVANYLPISVARSLDAVTVVAVDVTRPPEELGGKSPAAMGSRAIGLLMRNALRDTLPDVLVKPDIDPAFTGAVFPEDLGHLLHLGVTAALSSAPILPLKSRGGRALPPLPERFSGLVVETADPALEALTRRVFADVAPGAWSTEGVLAAVDRLYATGLVGGVWPRVGDGPELVAEERGEGSGRAPGAASPDAVLVVRVDPRPRTSILGDVGYDNDRGGRAWGGVHRRTSVLGRPLEVDLTASVNGLERWLQADLRLHPLDAAVAWSGGVHRTETDVPPFLVEAEGESQVVRLGGWTAVEHRRIAPDWIAVLGAQTERVQIGEGADGLSGGPFLRVFQSSPPALGVGVPNVAEAAVRLGEIDYWTAAARGSRSFALGPFPAAAVLEVGLAGGGAPPDVLPALGDRRAMPGFRWDEAVGEGTVVGGVDVARSIPAGGLLRLRLRAGGITEDVEAPDDLGTSDAWVAGAALEGLWPIPFGPVLLGVEANTRGRWRFSVSLGPMF